MAEPQVTAIRAVYERWSEGDFMAGGDLFDEGTVFILSPDFPDAGAYLGPAAIVEYMRGFLEPWERLTISLLGLELVGDTVVANIRQQGIGRASGAETGFDYFQLWTFRGETVVRLENLMTRAEADAAVGR